MHDANAKGAAKLARICREMGVERFIHVSALGADPEHKTKYLKNVCLIHIIGIVYFAF